MRAHKRMRRWGDAPQRRENQSFANLIDGAVVLRNQGDFKPCSLSLDNMRTADAHQHQFR